MPSVGKKDILSLHHWLEKIKTSKQKINKRKKEKLTKTKAQEAPCIHYIFIYLRDN